MSLTPEQQEQQREAQRIFDSPNQWSKAQRELIKKYRPSGVMSGLESDNRVVFRTNMELLDFIEDMNDTSGRLSRRMIFVGWVGVAVAIVGVILAVLTGWPQLSAQKVSLDEKLRCKKLADEFVAEQEKLSESSTGSAVWFFENVKRVDYSPSRQSCIIADDRITDRKGKTTNAYLVRDLVTSETLYGHSCSEEESKEDYCGNGRNVKLEQEQMAAFERAMTHSKMK